MSRRLLTLSSLSTINGGRIAAAFAKGRAILVNDCTNRPGNTKKRTLTITMTVTPAALRESADDGSPIVCEKVATSFNFQTKLPDTISETIEMAVSGEGNAFYDELSLDDIGQPTLDFPDGQGEPAIELEQEGGDS